MESTRWGRAAKGLLNNINMSVPILVGALFGSIAAGNPLTSYIIGGELLGSGISCLMAIAIALLMVLIAGIFA